MREQKATNGQWPNAKSTEEQTRQAKVHHAVAFDASRRKRPPITLPKLRCLAEPVDDASRRDS